MNIPEVQNPRYEQAKQFINFVEGKDNEAPDPATFPVHVLTGDTFLYLLNGGDAAGEADPFITDILVYPSAEYWTTLLSGTRQRPYFDLSISEYNTLRIPSAIQDYDLYVDSAIFYEDVQIDGTLTCDNIDLGTGDITTTGDITADEIYGIARTKLPILAITTDLTLADSNTGYVIQSNPATANTNVTLPASGITAGTSVTVMNCLAGKTTTFVGTLLARGTVLSEQYSAATIYYDGSDWYGIGDLV